MADEVVVFGRRFTVTVEGPDADRRYSATIREIATGRLLTRAPVRGRSASDAWQRALEVAHNLLGIERLQEIVVEVAGELAPGASVQLEEDARTIRADLAGPWRLAVPLAFDRELVYDPAFEPESARPLIWAHLRTHLRPEGS
ncbi:MAG TPA: hypothetical protein VNN19_07385 [bacterium]|nr:hypothetical protein [bacterium]